MISKKLNAFRGNLLTARVLRSSSWIILGFGGAQFIRLASNLILTRILFPEAFGIMSIVTAVTVGLMMFSDVGAGPAIARSPRGDEPDFLDTAWTLQILRGFLLFGVTILMAYPVANFYAEPDLALYLPIAGIALLISGFHPTRIETASRHLLVGRLTVLDLLSQLIGIGAMVVLALITQSVLALVIGPVITSVAKLILTHFYLEGKPNRLRLERAALGEQISFGKWIFFSTAASYVHLQGDKILLGKLMTFDQLGLYNIGFFLASFPIALGSALNQKILIPVLRDRPPAASAENRAKLRRVRFVLTGGMMSMLAGLALVGPWLVEFLYDDRYTVSGAILVLIVCGQMVFAVGLTHNRPALTAGDSRGAFVLSVTRSVGQMLGLYLGFLQAGLVGGLIGISIAALVVHPLAIKLAQKHAAWDALHDGLFLVLAALVSGVAIWLHLEEIMALGAAFAKAG